MITPSTPRPRGGGPITPTVVSSTPVYTNRSSCPPRPGTANAAYLASTRSAAAATICGDVAVRSRPEDTASTARTTVSNWPAATDEVTDVGRPDVRGGGVVSRQLSLRRRGLVVTRWGCGTCPAPDPTDPTLGLSGERPPMGSSVGRPK